MKFPEQYRTNSARTPDRHSRPGDPHGTFLIPASAAARRPYALWAVASSGHDWEQIRGIFVPEDSLPWEHVSLSVRGVERCPTWEEMCYVKSLFWDDEETVVQYHPPKSEYVNQHPYTLHLWRPVGIEVPRPPSICVGGALA